MSEPEADEEEVDHHRELLSCAVLPDDRSGGPDSEYPVGLFHAPYGTRIQKVALVVITEAEERLVVAVPFKSWHRTVAKRILLEKALTKFVAIQVPFEDREVEGVARVVPKVKVWVALLNPDFEELVHYDADDEEPPDLWFDPEGPTRLPDAAALVQIAEQQFTFQSAASAVGEPSVQDRLQSLEAAIASVTTALKELKPDKSFVPAAPTPKWPPAAPVSRAVPEAPPGLDPEVVKSAQAAGVSYGTNSSYGKVDSKRETSTWRPTCSPFSPSKFLSQKARTRSKMLVWKMELLKRATLCRWPC